MIVGIVREIMVEEYSTLINDVNNGGKAYLWEDDKGRIIELLGEFRAKGSTQLSADIELVIEELREGDIGELLGFTPGN